MAGGLRLLFCRTVVKVGLCLNPTLEIQFKFAAHGCAQTVEELAGMAAAGVVLNIARIEMVRDIENDNASTRLLIEERKCEAFEDGRIKRQEHGKAGLVARADEIQPIVDERE